jgi:hypothetical protein
VEEEEEEDSDAFAEATSGEMAAGAWDVESETTPSGGTRATPAGVLAAAGASPEWGGLWVGLLGLTAFLMLLLTFVSMDLVLNLYSAHSDTPGSGLVRTLAGFISK